MSKTILKYILGILFLLGAAVVLWGGSWFHVFEKNELDVLDLMFRLRPPIAVTDRVVIIEIDNSTIKKIGHFPFHRGYHAKLIDALVRAGAKALVFDIFFSEPRSGDKDMLDAMSAGRNVYLPYVFELAPQKPNEMARAVNYSAQNLSPFVSVAKGTGYINVISDPDGKFRRVPLFVHYGKVKYPALALLVGSDYLGTSLAQDKIPLDENSNLIVNFAGKWVNTYQHYSFGDVVESYEDQTVGKKPVLDLNIFKGKICLVGYTADGTTDLHPSPLEPLYPSIGIHADIINSMIHKKFIARASRVMNLWILVALGVLILAASLRASPLQAFGFLLEIEAIFVIISVMLFNKLGLWIDVFYPLLITGLVYLLCTLYKSILHFKERIILENEFKIAKQIQESFVPAALPEVDGFDMAAVMMSAREVGGDLYDVIKFDEGTLGVMVGDVAGKGISASLFMTMTVSSFKFFAKPQVRPQETLFSLNEKIFRETASNRFVTLYYSLFNLKTRVMSYANGGHLPVLYLAKDRKDAIALDVDEGLPLGMMNSAYSGRQIKFDSGDVFIYYTDGITEASNTQKEMYGFERLKALVQIKRSLLAGQLLDEIVKDVMKFQGKRKQQDDITLIVIKVL
ncbi:MAG: CHASE2 domain-containing protein [Candidatus Omnitrophica bacterium]|nr:CHASE2 domain-containing protein [Candidatus Omnitrophota bacterium]